MEDQRLGTAPDIVPLTTPGNNGENPVSIEIYGGFLKFFVFFLAHLATESVEMLTISALTNLLGGLTGFRQSEVLRFPLFVKVGLFEEFYRVLHLLCTEKKSSKEAYNQNDMR